MARALDAASIADAAIALVDAHGVDALSMRRVGAELGVSGMALYRHVSDRDDLLRRMVARIATELPPVSAADADWRETLHRLGMTAWAAFERHPWLIDLAVSPTRLVDATSTVGTETVLRRLMDAGCPPERAGEIFVAVAALPIGIARVTLARTAERGVDYADAAEPGPLTTAFRARPFDAARGRRLLETALDALLDGVAASLTRASGANAPGTPQRKESK
jgi:AcrR family transcriptional regulator